MKRWWVLDVHPIMAQGNEKFRLVPFHPNSAAPRTGTVSLLERRGSLQLTGSERSTLTKFHNQEKRRMEAEAGEQAQDGGAQPAPPLRRHQGGPQDPFPTEAEVAQDHRGRSRGSLASQEVPPACATP